MLSNNKRRATKPSLIANNTIFDNCIKQQRYDYIPLDYVSCLVIGLSKSDILSNKKYELVTIKDIKGNKIEILNFKGIKIKFYENSIRFQGSLHKYSNDGFHNFDQFTQDSFNEVIQRLFFDFNIEPKNLYILGLEYGVNILPPVQTDVILNGLMMHRIKEFEQKISNDKGKFYQCEHGKYILKVYNKGKQFKLPNEVLRIEIKQKNWFEYRKKGYDTLESFINADKSIFVDKLLRVWDELILYDFTIQNSSYCMKYSNLNFWRYQYLTNSSTTVKTHFDRLKKLSKTSGLNVIELTTKCIIEALNNVQGVTKYP